MPYMILTQNQKLGISDNCHPPPLLRTEKSAFCTYQSVNADLRQKSKAHHQKNGNAQAFSFTVYSKSYRISNNVNNFQMSDNVRTQSARLKNLINLCERIPANDL